jgi:hypothetical protein
MTFPLLFSFLVAVLVGFFLVGIFWPAPRPLSPLSFLRWFLIAGVGMGISSCLFFLWLLIFGHLGYGLFEMGILLSLAALFFMCKKGQIVNRGEDLFAFPLGSLRFRQILAFFFMVSWVALSLPLFFFL